MKIWASSFWEAKSGHFYYLVPFYPAVHVLKVYKDAPPVPNSWKFPRPNHFPHRPDRAPQINRRLWYRIKPLFLALGTGFGIHGSPLSNYQIRPYLTPVPTMCP